MAPEYATVDGLRVQVLDRFRARADCRVCGGDGWLDHDGAGGDCEFCRGSGKELKATGWARVGFLEGADRGHSRVVSAGALTAVSA
jgi:hypothetical protein